MAKPDKYDKQHLLNLGLTQRQITSIFEQAAKEAAYIGASIDDFNPDKSFSFADYPQTKARIDRIIQKIGKNTETVIVNGVRSEWTLANNKNNALCDRVFGDNKYKLTKAQERRYYSNNDKAQEAFLNRKVAGLNLSDRVWNYTNQFKNEIEMGLDLGIRNGLPAAEMARDLKQYLKRPDELFRRFRFRDKEAEDRWMEKHPNWEKEGLKKPDKIFNPRKWKKRIFDETTGKYKFADVDINTVNPGQGVYRSSYKNAMRLARTETNMAYRTADHERIQQFDFVVGIEIRLSNNHTINGVPFTDICDDLKGKYPKDFKFTGWHPQCRCHSVSILKTPEELMQENEAILEGKEPDKHSINEIKDVPDNFKQWVSDNRDRIERAEKSGTLPYFLKDNAIFAGIFVNNINVVNRTELLKEATAKYNAYDSQTWEKAYFDKFSGGFNVYHKEHNFSKRGGGGDAEIAVGKMLAKYNGKQIEFLSENSYQKSPDINFDGQTWDIKLIDNANEETIRNYIKDARKAENAIFYWNENDKLNELKGAVVRSIGYFKKKNELDTMPDIYYINKNGVLKSIFIK